MLLISSICGLFVLYTNYKQYKNDVKQGEIKYIFFWFFIQGLLGFIRDATFNVSHWMFAFEYYRIGRFMPLALQNKPVSSKTINNTRLLNLTLLLSSMLIPLLEFSFITVNLFIYNGNTTNIWAGIVSEIFRYACALV